MKISRRFLVENAKPFIWYANYYSTVNNEGRVCIFCYRCKWTNGRIFIFLICSLYSFQWYITLRLCLNKHRPSAKQHVSTVNCEHNYTGVTLILRSRWLVFMRFCDVILVVICKKCHHLSTFWLSVLALINWSYSERKLWSFLKLAQENNAIYACIENSLSNLVWNIY